MKHTSKVIPSVPPPTPEELTAARSRAMEHARERTIANAEAACNTMEGFLRTARRQIAGVRAAPDARDLTQQLRFLSLPEQMLHELAWGFANASSHIQSSMAAALDYTALEKTS